MNLPTHPTDNTGLQHALIKAVGRNNVLFAETPADAPKLLPYLEESRRRQVGKAFAAVFPATTAEVAKIVIACQAHNAPMVPQGGNTGRCLGAQSDDSQAVIINLRKLNRIRELDGNNMTVTAEAGVILQQLQQKADEHGLLFPLSLGAEGSCQIGGNLATNAGGVNVLRYGNTRDLTLGIEAVLPDGSVLNELYGLRKNNTGYDLKNLLIGSEGTLGIITAATFKLFPPETNSEHGFIAVNSVSDALRCLQRTQQRFVGKLSCFEIMPNIAMRFMERHSDLRCPIGNQHAWYIWYKLADASPDTSLFDDNLAFLQALMTDGLVVDATVSQNEAMKQLFWQIRETIVEVQRFEGASVKFDIAVPVSAVPNLIATVNAAIDELCPNIRPYPFGHLGDGNLHYNLSRPSDMADEIYLNIFKSQLYQLIHDIVRDMRGSFSAEHGVGSQKLGDMLIYKDPTALDLMRRIKHVFDPHALMNPGKVIPNT